MKSRWYQFGLFMLAVTILCLFPHCTPTPGVTIPGKATGGGSIAKTNGGTAHFGFNGSSCSGVPSGRFNYNDKSPAAVAAYGKPGVMLNGTITGMVQCVTGGGCVGAHGTCPEGGYIATFDYSSTNPFNKGAGTGGACLVDGGEGKAAPSDQAAVGFDTGPFAGYSAEGSVSGNVQGHLCE